MKRRPITVNAAIALAFILILSGACRKASEKTGEGRIVGSSSGGSAETAPVAILFAEIFVNDLRAASLTPDLPVIVRVAFDAPDAPAGWTPGDQAGLSLAVKDSAGKNVAVEAERLPGVSLSAGASPRGAAFHWVFNTALPPGEYEVGLKVPGSWAGGKAMESAEIRVEAASLRIVEGAAGLETKSYWSRRRLLLGGRAVDYLKAVDEALAGKPSDSGLRLERVEGMVMTGDKATAARELSKLLYDIQEAQGKNNPGREPHIPSWLMDYLASLK